MRRLVSGICLIGLLPALAFASGEQSSEAIPLAPLAREASSPPATLRTKPAMPTLQIEAQVGQHCSTQVGICVLHAPGPLGHPCTCMSSLGLVPGRIVP